MKEKIRDYILYQFRNIEKTKEVEEAIEEAYLNLVELYESFLEKQCTEEQAYIKSVEQLGDFSSHFQDVKHSQRQTIRPEWSESSLVGGLVASAFSVPMMFINLIWGALFLFIGLVTYFVPAYFYYKHARFVLETKKDVEYHNMTLKKIFTFYHYHSYAWIVSVSMLITSALASIVSSGLLFLVLATSEQTIAFTEIDQFLMNIMINALLFFIIFVIIFFITKHINKKIIAFYENLTGDISSKTILSNKLKKTNVNIAAVVKVVFAVVLTLFLLIGFVQVRVGALFPETFYYSLTALALAADARLFFSVPIFITWILFISGIALTFVQLKWDNKWLRWMHLFSFFTSTILFLFVFSFAKSANPHIFFMQTNAIYFCIFVIGIVFIGLDLSTIAKPTKKE